MELRENSKEPMQSVSHMLLHHLPPNAQTDESHQAERLETDDSACLHPAGKPAQSRLGDRSIAGCLLIIPKMSKY